jgi:hypothetical protein
MASGEDCKNDASEYEASLQDSGNAMFVGRYSTFKLMEKK